jgi:uridine kinase
MSDSADRRRPAAQLIDEIGNFIRHYKPAQMLRVGIDGVDGVGKTVFADAVSRVIETRGRCVIRASVDGFHKPRDERYRRGRASPEGFYFDSYDYAALKRVLLEPLGPHGSRIYCRAIFDHVRDAPLSTPMLRADPASVLVFDGIFLHRPELRNVWDFSIFLDAPFEITVPRGAARGDEWGSPDVHAASNQRYIEGQRLYIRESEPQTLANLVIDYADLVNPTVIAGRWPELN